jgi:hypothetical protein
VEGEGGGPVYLGCQGALGSTDLIFPGGWLKEKVQAEDILDNSEAREEQQQVHSMEQKPVGLANLVVGSSLASTRPSPGRGSRSLSAKPGRVHGLGLSNGRSLGV